MKRFVLCCLAVVLLFCTATFAAETPRLFLDVRSVGEGTYQADICVEGIEQAHRLSAVRVCLSYPADRLSCVEWKKGEALYQASFSMTPQYTHSNPAIFIAMDINRALTLEGVLATFTFEAAEGAEGKCLLDLGVIDAVDLDSKPLELFEISDVSIDLGTADAPADEPIEILPDDGLEKDPNRDFYNTNLPGTVTPPEEDSATDVQDPVASPEEETTEELETNPSEESQIRDEAKKKTDEETDKETIGDATGNLWWILCAGAAVLALAAVFVIVWCRKNGKSDEQA